MKIYMIGDSIMANYDEVKEYPRRGWGQQLSKCLKSSNAEVVNYALPGWTTQLFIDTKRISEVFDSMQHGDFLVMQFGHNDQKSTDPNYVPLNKYRDNLKYFAVETLKRGATPIICSPITRLLFSEDGSLKNTGDAGLFEHTLKDYATAAQSAAKESDIPFVDLFCYSQQELASMTKEQSRRLYMILDAKDSYWLEKNPDYINSDYFLTGENPNDPYSYNPDFTHTTIEGADKWAAYFVGRMKDGAML